jgi:exodeoxyribonuclease-1
MNIEKLKVISGLTEKIVAVFSGHSYSEQEFDPDLSIYSGGFFSEADKQKMSKIRSLSPEQLAKADFSYTDPRLPEMLFRYRARNYPDTLSAQDQLRWNDFCKNRLSGQQVGASITLVAYQERLQELRNNSECNKDIINALDAYAIKLSKSTEITDVGVTIKN